MGNQTGLALRPFVVIEQWCFHTGINWLKLSGLSFVMLFEPTGTIQPFGLQRNDVRKSYHFQKEYCVRFDETLLCYGIDNRR